MVTYWSTIIQSSILTNSSPLQVKCHSFFRIGTVLKAITFHPSGPGSIPELSAKCGLNLWAQFSALRGISLATHRHLITHTNCYFHILPSQASGRTHLQELSSMHLLALQVLVQLFADYQGIAKWSEQLK